MNWNIALDEGGDFFVICHTSRHAAKIQKRLIIMIAKERERERDRLISKKVFLREWREPIIFSFSLISISHTQLSE